MKWFNPFMAWLLRSPLHFFVSNAILLLSVTGRKSGAIYTTPVQYRRVGDTVYTFTNQTRTWWKNLRGGAPVTMIVKGKRVQGTANALTDHETVVRTLKTIYPRMSEAQVEKFAANGVAILIQV
jgi:deazaflavin-dependent oxidoreductase (nitroreductase family)